MKFNPDIHHRRSIRLDGYDYSREGVYFFTICTQNRECVFGEVLNGAVLLNDAGEMICKWWAEMLKKFPLVESDEFILMPNHLHGIVGLNVGAALCGRPDTDTGRSDAEGRPHRVAPTLGEIVGWFKTMTTNEYIRGVRESGWTPFFGKLWQRNYYDHIIRSEKDLSTIRKYIMENPLTWFEDENHPEYVHGHFQSP